MEIIVSPSKEAADLAKILGLPEGTKSFTLTAPEKGAWVIDAVIYVKSDHTSLEMVEKKYFLVPTS